MADNTSSQLYLALQRKGFNPNHVAEVGVWQPGTSNIRDYILAGIRTTLVEPDPESIELIRKQFPTENLTLHEVAIYDRNGELELCKRAASTFVKSLPSSPTLVNDRFEIDDADTLVVQARVFNEIDDGSIDLISIDVEGSEWYVLQNMLSRPAVISIETHGGLYTNPYLEEIRAWLDDNQYLIWYKDKSDSVYVRKDSIHISLSDRLRLFLRNIHLALRTFRKRVKRLLQQR
jgi:FkbM family methyltransferase